MILGISVWCLTKDPLTARFTQESPSVFQSVIGVTALHQCWGCRIEVKKQNFGHLHGRPWGCGQHWERWDCPCSLTIAFHSSVGIQSKETTLAGGHLREKSRLFIYFMAQSQCFLSNYNETVYANLKISPYASLMSPSLSLFFFFNLYLNVNFLE